jgi:hypothetical protein
VKFRGLLIIKGNVIHAYLNYSITCIQKQLMDIASLIKKMPGKSAPVTDHTQCINKTILYSEINEADHISEVLKQS